MKYSFHPEAEAEFNQAIDYYENCAEGLGYEKIKIIPCGEKSEKRRTRQVLA